MSESAPRPVPLPGDDELPGPVPEEPFGIPHRYWEVGILVLTLFLAAALVIVLVAGGSPQTIGTLFVIPAILFAYFFRRKGVVLVFLLGLFYLAAVAVFRYQDPRELVTAAFRALLLTAVAFFIAYLTSDLLHEKRKYHAIFDNTENGVLLVRLPDHVIIEHNQRFISALALPSSSVQGKTLESFVVDPTSLAPLFSALDAHCRVPATETVMRRGDGSLWVAIIACRKISAEHAVMTFIDITERRRLDEQLRQCHAETSLYLDILTHDINNINTASLNYGRILAVSAPGSRPDLLPRLVGSLEKSDEIIRNISTLRRMQETSPAPVRIRLADVIRGVIAGFPDARIEYDGTDAVVLADDMLSSVFANLIGNSIKYGRHGGLTITIQVTPGSREVGVAVADNGPGIPDSVKPLIFDRFQRGDTTVSGKGLGLFICRSLVTRYGGIIRVEDRVPGDFSQGTVFSFTLPAAQP
jgi:signal transduction histidine kinase